jgi:hypothetical protein
MNFRGICNDAMPTDLSKPHLLAAIRRERVLLDALLAPLDDAQMLAPARDDGWSPKDVLAHITAWERRLLTWLQRWRTTGSPQRPEPGITFADESVLNERDYLAAKDTPVADVWSDADVSYRALLGAVEMLSDADLEDQPEGEDGPSWSWIIGANTHEHYKEHRQEIERWMSRA